MSNQYEIVKVLVSHLSLEDKETLRDEIELMIEQDIEELPYQPDHYDEYRATEMRALAHSN